MFYKRDRGHATDNHFDIMKKWLKVITTQFKKFICYDLLGSVFLISSFNTRKLASARVRNLNRGSNAKISRR